MMIPIDPLMKKMKDDGAPKSACISFDQLYNAYQSSPSQYFPWQEVNALSTSDYQENELEQRRRQKVQARKNNLDQLAVIKLNGGLGTSMGCEDPKALIKIDREQNFLDQIIKNQHQMRQDYLETIPLILMNSFYTDKKIKQYLQNNYSSNDINSFQQHRFPRINQATGQPFAYPEFPDKEWNPAGHGNIYIALESSGVLDTLLAEGKEVAFISNIDNLGARIDPIILDYFIENRFDFMLEVAPKIPADKKGGTIIKYNDQFTLLEQAQVHPSHYTEFEDTSIFPIFNTNSLWINLVSLKEKLRNQELKLPVIINPKTVNGTDVIQLETAMGAAISQFNHTGLIYVDRSRFLPVKTTVDLLMIRSDLFYQDAMGHIKLKEAKQHDQLPKIKWSSEYQNINIFNQRFQEIPSLIECDSLTINGAVFFGPNVTLQGHVNLSTDHSEYLENCTVINNDIIRTL